MHLSFDLQSARKARDFVRLSACPVHQPDGPGDAELLVSELVANGVRHGAPPISLTVDCLGSSGLQVAVSDGEIQLPQLVPAAETGATTETGRGLQLVDYLSDSWGVDRGITGKTTWFRLTA